MQTSDIEISTKIGILLDFIGHIVWHLCGLTKSGSVVHRFALVTRAPKDPPLYSLPPEWPLGRDSKPQALLCVNEIDFAIISPLRSNRVP